MNTFNIPISEKYVLSIMEAAEYFHIGHTKIRQLISDEPDADFILRDGNRTLIKRKLFEKYIDNCSVI